MQARQGRLVVVVGGLAVSVAGAGCADGCQESAAPSAGIAASASAGAVELSPELRSKVLARVGDTEITLGQYVATLERMNEFERLRYQSADRRKLLLDEMVQVELLAVEARRRGLDKLPETRARLRQILRDELLLEARRSLPDPAALPAADVRAYYEAHRQEFQEPERRRVAHIQVSDEKRGRELLEQAMRADQKEWGRLVRKHSTDRRAPTAVGDPIEFAGDLGIVAKPGIEGGENSRVPEAIRQAVFKIGEIGGVYPELVKSSSNYHVVRMIGKTDARTRSLKEAERMIRLRLVERLAHQLEQELEQELRQRFRVVVDPEALKKLDVPQKFEQ